MTRSRAGWGWRGLLVMLMAGMVAAADEASPIASAAPAPAEVLQQIPLAELRAMLKGYPAARDWRLDTPQGRGEPEPPHTRFVPPDASRIDLPEMDPSKMGAVPLFSTLRDRRSVREYGSAPLDFHELGILLWSGQGVTAPAEAGRPPLRTAPSAGGRFPLETYVIALQVDGLSPGVHRYLPDSHQLVTVGSPSEPREQLVRACYNQDFVGTAAVAIVWTAVPRRTEWKYGYLSHRMIAMEAGHACQNIYLACQALGAGACALLGYDQAKMDALLGVDGEEEFAVYLAVVGTVEK